MENQTDEKLEKNTNSIKNKFIGRKAREEIKEKIEEKEEKLGRELRLHEKRKIEASVIRKVRIERAIRGAFLALGITIGAGSTLLLTSGNNEKQAVESEYDAGKTDREKFVEGLAVEQKDLNKEVDKNSREYIAQQIEDLKTPNEVLDYIKDIYVKEYNEKNEDDISKEQLTFHKSRYDYDLYTDEAKNGDTIIRYSSSKNKGGLDASRGVISLELKQDDKLKKEKVFYYGDDYKTIYDENANVEQYSDNFLTELAPIIDTGIDWSVAMNKDATSDKIKDEYKNRLVNAVYEHNNEKTQTTDELEHEEHD